MATFHHLTTDPSPTASRLLHPASADHLAPADVLPEIAAGLARTVPEGTDGGRQPLLVTPAYEATLEIVEPDSCGLIDATGDRSASFAVVAGQLMAWTGDGTELLSAGGLCSIEAGEQVQLVNIGTDRAVVVLVRAHQDPAAPDTPGLTPCAPAAAL